MKGVYLILNSQVLWPKAVLYRVGCAVNPEDSRKICELSDSFSRSSHLKPPGRPRGPDP